MIRNLYVKKTVVFSLRRLLDPKPNILFAIAEYQTIHTIMKIRHNSKAYLLFSNQIYGNLDAYSTGEKSI